MERFRRVAGVWNWLPAFRGIAEHESIQKASTVLATSPSALSRTLKLLEEALDVELFERRGASLVLTEDGGLLLTATRNAMRLIDDALPSDDDGVAGDVAGQPKRLWLGAASSTASAVIEVAIADPTLRLLARPAVADLQHHHDQTDALRDALVRGDVDIVLSEVSVATTDDVVVVERLGDATHGIYASAIHPLARLHTSSATPLDVSAERFAVRRGGDGWPPERARVVAESTSSLEGVLALAASGEFLICLADIVVERLFKSSLVRIDTAGPPQTFYAFRRKLLEGQDARAADAVVAAIRACLR